jgi:hypothetical protein
MNGDEIKVSVIDSGPGRSLMMRYIDPVTGKQVWPSRQGPGTGKRRSAGRPFGKPSTVPRSGWAWR